MKRVIVLALCTLAIPLASAEPYAGLGAAWLKTDPPRGTTADDTSRLFAVPVVGYRLSRFAAIEASYWNAGEVASSFDELPKPSPTQILVTTRTFNLSAFGIHAMGRYPLSEAVFLTGALGAYRLSGEMRETDVLTDSAPPGSSVTGERSTSGSAIAPSVALGMELVKDRLGGRLQVNYIGKASGVYGDGVDLRSALGVGAFLFYSF